MLQLNDAHCHFFSTPFFAALGRGVTDPDAGAPHDQVLGKLGWNAPGSAAALADCWIAELDRAGVTRAALISSVPGDAESVAAAVARHPRRLVGLFMSDPTRPDAAAEAVRALDSGLRGICLFPAMHRFPVHDDRVRALFDIAAGRPGTVVFVHCGVLTVGVRRRLGLPSPFDMRFGNPLDLHAIALAYSAVPIIVPHFGAGLLREALMLADLCPNVRLDTSSSNGWMKYHPGLTLDAVLRQALAIAGPDRLLFGSDSSWFPRGWVRQVFDDQSAALDRLGAAADVKAKVFGGNFDRLFSL
jgi:uncharacterized protein